MEKSKQIDIYDIKEYTDKELFELLDLDSPSDRELEAKTISLIEKYQNIETDSARKVSKFFEDIYNHFFDSNDSEENVIEGFDDYTNPSSRSVPSSSNNVNLTRDPTSVVNNGDRILTATTAASISASSTSSGQSSMISMTTPTAPSEKQIGSTLGYTTNLDYRQDQLNPLLKQTIKRIVSIDSQYRDDKSTMTTEFTFNLSDPLKDVVSLKLYSVQIPYTWYTIDTAFGSNFFYLKGNSPGIDNGNHDIKIEIPSGNYSPNELVTAINNNISDIARNIYTDISFGTTRVTYNSSNSLSTIAVDVTKQFSETAYYLQFNESKWVSPMIANQQARLNSIPSFLGFELSNNTYYPYRIKSLPFNYNAQQSSIQTIYTITTNNNYFTVYRYIDTAKTQYDITVPNMVDFSFNITLSLPVGSNQSSVNILTDLNNQIMANTSNYLDVSKSYIKLITTKSTSVYQGQSYYELSLKLNRYTTSNDSNSKLAIIFPDETQITNTIWIGTNSVFNFGQNIYRNNIQEINNIISEYAPLQETDLSYSILTTPYTKLHCIKKGFDCSTNDILFSLSNTPTGVPYNKNEYLTAINNSFNNGILDYSISPNDYYNISSKIDETNKYTMNIDVNRNVTQKFFRLNFSGSVLTNYLLFEENYDLSTNSIINNTIASILKGTFSFNPNNVIARIVPMQTNNIVSSDASYAIYPKNPDGSKDNFIVNYNDLGINIADWFNSFQDSDDTYVFNGTTCIIYNSTTVDPAQYFDISLNISYNKVLTENDYNIQFFDVSSITQNKFDMVVSKYITDIPTNILETIYPPIPALSAKPYSKNQIGFLNSTVGLSGEYIIRQPGGIDSTQKYYYNSSFPEIPTIIDTSYLAYITIDSSNYLIPAPNASSNNVLRNVAGNYLVVPNILQLDISFNHNSVTQRIDCSFNVSVNGAYNGTIHINLNGYVYGTGVTNSRRILNGDNYDIRYIKTLDDNVKTLYSEYKIGGVFKDIFVLDPITDLSNNKINKHYNLTTSGTTNPTFTIDTSYMAFLQIRNQDIVNTNSKNYLLPSPSGNYNSSDFAINISNLFGDMRQIFSTYSDLLIDVSFSNISKYSDGYSTTNYVDVSMNIHINQEYNLYNKYSTWNHYLNINPDMIETSYELSNYHEGNSSITIRSIYEISFNYITITEENNKLIIIPDEEGIISAGGENKIILTIPSSSGRGYSRNQLLTIINDEFKQNPVLSNSYVYIKTDANGKEYTVFRVTVDKKFTASSYNLVFYDPYSFVKCYIGDKSIRNTAWDTTLGWILGFREHVIYELSTYIMSNTSIINVQGDTGVTTNLYNYFMICLDDYNQNRINDGLVTITGRDTSIRLPSYANLTNLHCDPTNGQMIYNTNTVVEYKKLTQNQIYSVIQIANAKLPNSVATNNPTTNFVNSNNYTTTPYVPDVFGIVPMKVSGLSNGQVYVEFGGTLQNQERTYFGPVTIRRMSIKLLSDKGDIVNLNNANWSFSLICEQIYKQNPTK